MVNVIAFLGIIMLVYAAIVNKNELNEINKRNEVVSENTADE